MHAGVSILCTCAIALSGAAQGQHVMSRFRELLVRGEVDSVLSLGEQALRAEDLSPLDKSRLLEIIGEQYHQLSDIGEAKHYWDEALSLRQRVFGDSSAEAAVGYAFRARYHDYMAAPQLDHTTAALKEAARAKRLMNGTGTLDAWERTLVLREFAYAFKVAGMRQLEDSLRLQLTRTYFREALGSAMRARDTVWIAQVTHDIGNTFNDEAGRYGQVLPARIIAHLADSAKTYYARSIGLMTGAGYGDTRSVMMDHFTTALLYTSAFGADSCAQAVRCYDDALEVLLRQAGTAASLDPLRYESRIKDPAQMVELLYLRAMALRMWDEASPGEHLDMAISTLEAAVPYWEQLLRDYRSRDIEKVIGSYSHFPFRLGTELLLKRYRRDGHPEDLHNSLVWSERNRQASMQRKRLRAGLPALTSDAEGARPEGLVAPKGVVIVAYNHSSFHGAFVVDDKGLSIADLEDIPAAMDRSTGQFNEFIVARPGWTPEIFAQEAHIWYTQLLKPVLEHRQAKEIVIVPYGSLALLPFEALCTSPVAQRWNEVAFLGNRYTLRYARSIAEALMPPAYCPRPDAFLATAQVDSLSDLPFAKALALRLHGERPLSVLDSDLTSAELMGALASPGSILLATHGVNPATPDAAPFFLLADGPWPASELIDRTSQRTLAVLSTCSSGSGRNFQGEGVMSMAHAFLGAGTKAVVHALWPVDDRATSEILGDFHMGLEAGLPASEALAQAKTGFIARHADDGLAEPFYWSGIVLSGTDVEMEPEHRTAQWYVIAALPILTGGYLFARRRRRSRARAAT